MTEKGKPDPKSATIDLGSGEIPGSRGDVSVPLNGSRDEGSRPTGSMDHYVIEELLGTGASGQVYRAHDPKLDRQVALKLLRDVSDGGRVLREARLQARLEHAHIAQIYETGVREGRPAVAMQLVRGGTFGEARQHLDLDAQLLVLEQVARAVHFAHRGGLVHRDLKPANVLVETDELGQPHGYVVDFGIATEIETTELTMTGGVVGTPEYMAPEQLRGERSRSADVYSLGVMLFEVLTDRRPHQADSRVDLMMSVMSEPALPVRKVAEVPADLAAITDRAIAFEPEDRYRSACELADDLAAYRDGRPVSARPLSSAQRVVRWVRRNRALAAVAAVVVTTILALAGTALVERLRSQQRAELAQRFGSDARDIEWTLRAVEMSPLHDSSTERRELTQRIDEVEQQIGVLGSASEGPGYSAVGRAHLALGDSREALQHLERSIDSGYKAPEASMAMGLALAGVYREEVAIAAGMRSKSQRETRLAEIDASYRQPAVELLRTAKGPSPWEQDYLEATLALLDGDHDRAEELAAQAAQSRTWLYEGHTLRANIEQERAQVALQQGDHAAADAAFGRAAEALETALDVAQSSAEALIQRCQLWSSVLDHRLYVSGGDLLEPIRNGTAACAEAALVLPESDQVWRAWASFERRRGIAAGRSGQEGDKDVLESAREFARKAVDLDPDSASNYQTLGLALKELGSWNSSNGGDPRPKFREAIDVYDQAVRLEPTASRWSNYGLALSLLARHEGFRGGDSTSVSEQAVTALEQAVALAPALPPLRVNLSEALKNKGLYELDHGIESAPTFDRAIAAASQAIALDSEYFFAYWTRGMSRWYLGEARSQAGVDGDVESLEESLLDFQRALEINPQYASAASDQGSVNGVLASIKIRRGEDPRPYFEAGLEALDVAYEINPRMVWIPMIQGLLLMDRASYERSASPRIPTEEIEALVRASRAKFDIGLQTNAGDPHGESARARTFTLEARLAEDEGRSPVALLNRSLQAFAKAMLADPGCAPCAADKGRAHMLLAKHTSPAEQLGLAAEALEVAHSEDVKNPSFATELAILEVRRCELGTSDCANLLTDGERWIETALNINPEWPAAHAYRGVLHTLAAERGVRGVNALTAVSSLEQAIEGRPAMARQFEDWLRRARAL